MNFRQLHAGLISSVVILGALVLSTPAKAVVDMNNASYSNTWIDMDVPGQGYVLKVLRAYKSRTIYNGMFGFGWCSDFETKLTQTAEGDIKISECGDGQETVYSLKDSGPKEVEAVINKIIEKEKVAQGNKPEQYWANLKKELFEDSTSRATYASKHNLVTPIKENQAYAAIDGGAENVVKSPKFFTRYLIGGGYQRYDLDGNLTHIYDKNGNVLKFTYDSKGLLTQLEDNNFRRLNFTYFPNKKVQKITGPNGLVAEYKYNQQEDLIWAKNAWAKKPTDVYTYTYNEFHNLVKATWPDKTFIEVKYDNVKDWVVGFTDRDRCVESYKFELSKTQPKFHYWSTVVKRCGKKEVANNKYEFWHKQRPTGEVVLMRAKTVVDGRVTDVSYHESFGKPVSIMRNNRQITFEYFPDGMIKSKTDGFIKLEYTHDSKTKKLVELKQTVSDQKGKIVLAKKTIFKYDEKGNIVLAENSDGEKVEISYDTKGRLAAITDQARKTVKIEYEDRLGKPSEITRVGLGSLKFKYNSNGDIVGKPTSTNGPMVATQILSTLNTMLKIYEPASQELYL